MNQSLREKPPPTAMTRFPSSLSIDSGHSANCSNCLVPLLYKLLAGEVGSEEVQNVPTVRAPKRESPVSVVVPIKPPTSPAQLLWTLMVSLGQKYEFYPSRTKATSLRYRTEWRPVGSRGHYCPPGLFIAKKLAASVQEAITGGCNPGNRNTGAYCWLL